MLSYFTCLIPQPPPQLSYSLVSVYNTESRRVAQISCGYKSYEKVYCANVPVRAGKVMAVAHFTDEAGNELLLLVHS